MHSRVYQIATHPIARDDLLDEHILPDFFVATVADYVVTVDDPAKDYDWFVRVQGGAAVLSEEKNSFSIIPGGKKKYFRSKYRDFMEKVALLTTTTLEAFSGEEAMPMNCRIDQLFHEAARALEDRNGFYVFQDGKGLVSLDAWMRDAAEGEIYYFGTVLDYHF